MSNSITRRKGISITGWLKYHFLEKKLNTVFGFLLLSVIGLCSVYGTVMVDYKIGPAVVIVFAAILLLVLFFKYPYFGLYFVIVISSIAALLERIVSLPVPIGTFLDILTCIELIVVLLNYDLKKQIDGRFWSNPISIGMYILFAFYLIELFNPAMFSKLGWFSYFRKQINSLIFFYLFYCLFNSKKSIVFFIYFVIGFTTLLALYACKQQWFGYAGFELRAIGSGGGMVLLFQGGLLRKLSVFGDPATSGILFASVAMFSLILFVRDTDKKRKFWLAVAVVINILGYSFSGTRTATLMVIAGIVFYSIATIYEKKTLFFLMACILAFVVLITAPYQNVVTNRIRSTFEGTKDLSAAVRDYDRHQVQPYIWEHPIGGGIYTCGFEGPKYAHGHYLEFLQPDSGYMKVVAEQGAVGLALLLLFYFIGMRHGIRNFYRVHDPEIQNYYIALLVMMFTMLVAQYSQMALNQYPVVYYYYASLILFIKLPDYDKKPNAENPQI